MSLRLFFVLSILSFGHVNGQDSLAVFSVKNTFFCNSYYPISKLWILNDGSALGARRFSLKEGSHIKDVVFIGRDGLIKDSLSIMDAFKSRDYFFQQIESISVESPTKVYVHTGKMFVPLLVKDNQLILEDTSLRHQRAKVLTNLYRNNKVLFAEYVLFHKGLLIGYDREKLKVKKNTILNSARKEEDNFPNFWIVDTSKPTYEKIYINKEDHERNTNALYWDVKDWDQTWSRVDVFARYVSVFNDKIYFSVARSNKCYVYDLNSGKITFINYPAIQDGESCHYYYDQITSNEYVIKRTRQDKFAIYLYDKDYSKVYLVKVLDYRPFAIVDNKVHLIKEVKEDRNRFLCHYLVPLKESDADKLTILQEVSVKN